MDKSNAAWVIHKQWSGETSARVLFFTRDRGLIQSLCKGGRLPKKQQMLQAFNPLFVQFHEHKTSCYVQQLELISPALQLEGLNLMSGLYVNELIYHAIQPLDAYPLLFDAYETVLQTLATPLEGADLAACLRHFEVLLLNEMGYGFSLTHEANHGEPIVANKHYILKPEEGLVDALKGIPGEYLIGWTDNQWHNPAVRQTAKIVLQAALDHALGGKILHTRKLVVKNA